MSPQNDAIIPQQHGLLIKMNNVIQASNIITLISSSLRPYHIINSHEQRDLARDIAEVFLRNLFIIFLQNNALSKDIFTLVDRWISFAWQLLMSRSQLAKRANHVQIATILFMDLAEQNSMSISFPPADHILVSS